MKDKRRGHFHPLSWSLWLLGALTPALIARNPFYITLMLIASFLVYLAGSKNSPFADSWDVLLRVGIMLAAFGALVNPLTVHVGANVLLTLPSIKLGFGTTKVLELGGRITLEALAYGLNNGLSLMLLVVIFAAFNLGADHYRMLRAIPFHHTGVVLSIAFTFVPQMMQSLKRIREAQLVRGHRFRSLRDLVPLVMPLLISGLEKAVQLAESMEARGFSCAQSPPAGAPRLGHRFALAVALFAITGGVAGQSMLAGRRLAGWDLRWAAGAILALGLSLFLWSLRALSRKRIRTRYRPDRWQRRDSLLALTSCAVAVGFAVAWILRDSTLWFYPYPALSLPRVNPYLTFLSAFIAAPVAIGGIGGAKGEASGENRNYDPDHRRWTK